MSEAGEARPVRPDDIDKLRALWQVAGMSEGPVPLEVELPHLDAELFLVVEREGELIASALGTFDGRRGTLSRVAVHPGWQGHGLASGLVAEVERRLRDRGCVKVNLWMDPETAALQGFYERLGYSAKSLIFMDKQL